MTSKNKYGMNPQDKIFATGVFLQAIEVEILGVKQWRWFAVSFEEDSYFDGQPINIYSHANSFEGLIIQSHS